MAPQSRNNISLSIAGGTDEYYDQICALSQKVINENFDILFKQREKEFHEVRYWDDANNAKLVCDLHPPALKLMIGASEEPEYYFELRIKTGSIEWKDGRSQDLNGFVVAVRAMLSLQDISPSSKVDMETAAERAPYYAEVRKSYDTSRVHGGLKAGDYSVERLFTNILESQWQSPDKDLSTLPNPKDPTKIITLRQWEADPSSQAQMKSTAAGKVLSNWAMDNSHSGLWTIGLQVVLPDTKKETEMATYLPVGVRRQNYPYLNANEDWEGVKTDGVQKLYGRDYNCLMFCEVVQAPSPIATGIPKPRSLPVGSRIAYGGNLADPDTPGTYVLDHRTFFHNRILKDLKQLCVAVNVIPLRPDMGVDDQRNHYFRSGLAVGTDPPNRTTLYPDVVKQDAAEPYFDFKYIGPGEYKWSKTQSAPGSCSETKLYENCAFAPIWRKWDMNSTQSITVKWTPGGNKITVTGEIKYRHWEAYSMKHSNWGWNGSGNDPFLYGAIKIDGFFSFDIIFKGVDVGVEGAGLTPEIVGIENGLPKNLKIVPDQQYVLDNTLTRLTQDVQSNLVKSLASITKNLAEGFKNTGKLTYPGTRTLKFGNPQISDHGDILSTITYQPLGKDLVVLNPPKGGTIGEPPKNDPAKPPQDNHIFKPQGNLSWKMTFADYTPENNRAKLVCVGSNDSDQPFAFDGVHIEWLANTMAGGTSLFTDRNKWETALEVEQRKQKALTEWEKKMDIERKSQIVVAQKEFEAAKAARVAEQQAKLVPIDKEVKDLTAKYDEAVRVYGDEKKRVDEAKRLADAAKKKAEEDKRSKEKKREDEKKGEEKKENENKKGDQDKHPAEPTGSQVKQSNIAATSSSADGSPANTDEQINTGAIDDGALSKGAESQDDVDPANPALAAAEKAMHVAKAALDESKKLLLDADAKLDFLRKQPFDETMVVIKLPDPPKEPTPAEENLQVYELTTSNIVEPLQINVQIEGTSVFFKVKQVPKGKLKPKSYRWYMPPQSSLTITIEGTVGKPGNFAAQIQETWNSTDPEQDYNKSKFSDVFWKYILLSGGSSFAQPSDQKEANNVRGIVTPSPAKNVENPIA
ncbi:hypothetical protein IQ07DRAFT_678149 [Pyrenochaeta sp. DS3sAY3a]|nr:hypothetical protein IQ07DRAFT_678149 [Pyrenochaeta sp. DS3sAY3a]